MSSKKGAYKPRYKKVRYSSETTSLNVTDSIPATTNKTFPDGGGTNEKGMVLVSPAAIQGTRKVKNMTLSVASTGNTVPMLCAVVYVPQGTDASNLTPGPSGINGASLYEPNQNVIMQFVMNPVLGDNTGSNVQVFRTKLARNLDSGDKIVFIATLANPVSDAATNVRIVGTFNYAISY